MKIIKLLSVFTLITTLTMTQTLTFAESSYESSVEGYQNVAPWYTEGIEEAIKWQIMPSRFKDVSMDAPITRGEFAEAIVLAYVRLTGSLPETWNSTRFSDQPNVYAQIASELEFVSGYTDGTYRSISNIKRQEMFVMINNLIIHFDSSTETALSEEQKNLIINESLLRFTDGQEVSDWAKQASSVLINLGILAGTDQGKIEPKLPITRAQAMVILTRTLKATDSQPVSLSKSNDALKQLVTNYPVNNEYSVSRGSRRGLPLEALYSYEELMVMQGNNTTKYTAVFGSPDAGRYATSEEALSHMVNITVDVWTLKSDGTKTPGLRTIRVNSAIADIFTKVFKEIYEGPEQFPIKDIYGYSWRSSSTSEHNLGLAVDINANENYMIRKDGSIVAGSFWLPGENPYSIKPDGDVVRAFKKYGFTWGGDAWPTSNDYMHFSFLGW
ncbi:MAG: M15 family metallopeptidase [Clostridia bacterium]|nr:M15 family metallopeptidase [Clostridia bacterium]